MSNTVITNYTDLNGPSTKAESSVVVIVNKDGSLSVDQNLLGTLMGTDGSNGAGISVVRVGHEGKPDDATDSDSDDDKVPHVTMSVDSYYDEPNSIIKYDSGAEMLQSLRIETRENSLLGFQNDHCYTLLTSPTQNAPQASENFTTFDEPVIEIKHTPPPKPVLSSNKKITILEQQIIPKGKKLILHPKEAPIILKGTGTEVLNKSLPVVSKHKPADEKETDKSDDSTSISSSGDSIPDRDSDSDYKDATDRSAPAKLKKSKPRILKSGQSPKVSKLEPKSAQRLKVNKNVLRREIKEKLQKNIISDKKQQQELDTAIPTPSPMEFDPSKVSKHTPKIIRKEKKTPSHVTALLSDMTSLFTSPDVIRRISTDAKPTKPEKETQPAKAVAPKMLEINEGKIENPHENNDKFKNTKTYSKPKSAPQTGKSFDLIPQIDDASLAQILDNTSSIPKTQPSVTPSATFNSPGLAGPLSPTLDLLAGLQPEEEGLTEDLLMHVAQLVESSENLQEVIDKQVLGKVDTVTNKPQPQPQTVAQMQDLQEAGGLYTPSKSVKNIVPRKEPIEIVRRDGRVITLPPIEAPATRSSKRKTQMETGTPEPVCVAITTPMYTEMTTPESQAQLAPHPIKQYTNKKPVAKKLEPVVPQQTSTEKMFTESQESWNSEDDPYRLWCICRQPHNNRFMICCDSCEDWFHGKCVNITKAMGQQMEEQGIEWRCPNCVKKTKGVVAKTPSKPIPHRKSENEPVTPAQTSSVSVKDSASKTSCIVCKKPARASSIYCSDACILKHAQDSLSHNTPTKIDSETGKPQEKSRLESRVIVYERKSGRLLAGPNAPTAEYLKAWLQKNPTFEVVRPGTLNTIKPLIKKKAPNEPGKIQTTLNFNRIPKKTNPQNDQVVPKTPEAKTLVPKTPQSDRSQKMLKLVSSPPTTPQTKTPALSRSQSLILPETPKSSTKADNARPSTSKAQDTPRMNQIKLIDTPKPGPSRQQDTPRPSTSKSVVEQKKVARSANRTLSTSYEKASTVSPSTSRRKEAPDTNKRMDSTDPIRENVRKALQEQITLRMSETKGHKFSEDDITQFANDTELELYELFSRDVGMKYKAKYRSLMFNIKDRKNLSLWQKICKREITPKQLVRLSPEELASQELAQWRAKEEKHQLELIKKSELDLLAASKTYVLKTHKGEEVMETKESVSTELDPNVAVENLVTALNESSGVQVDEEATNEESGQEQIKSGKKSGKTDKKHTRSKKDGSHSKKSSSKESKRDSESRKSRSRRSELKEETSSRSTRRSDRKKSRSSRSESKDKKDVKEKSGSSERSSRHRSRSRVKSRRRSKSRSSSASPGRGRSQSPSRDKRKRRSHSKRESIDEKKTRSKSQEVAKSKNDSTDSETLERPKSAMQKEIHPEYDPHEPMITSAFSEEDLRKDSFEESYKADMGTFGDPEYDPKAFSIDPILAPTKFSEKPDKLSEVESDQEPSSTVDNAAVTLWNGCINMVDVARFYVAAHEVSGNATDLEEDLAAELDIVGRINPDTVWDYIKKMKRASNKDIIILRLQAANDEEQMQYIALYSYLNSRNRLGVVKVSNTATVKDIYIVPIPANTTLPQVLLPIDGPGLGEVKTHLLIAIIIRQSRKRLAPHLPKEVLPAKVVRESRKRSYTPPVVKSSFTPPSSPRRRALPLPTYTSPALSTSVKDKIAASLAAANDEDEPYSPGSSTSSGSSVPGSSTAAPAAPGSTVLRTKMEELNRQIEEQKQQIMKMAGGADSSIAEDEAYSPSRPMTPAVGGGLADIALPSNLHEILATIKQRSAPATDVDMRTMP